MEEIDGKVIMLQPRRVAARSVASWMAKQLGERVGETVGYQVRSDRQISRVTRVEVITEGLLLNRLLTDPELNGVGVVILDEFHERSVNLDLSLMMLAEARMLRSTLNLVVMSATMDATPLCEVLEAPLITAEGRSFPVSINYLPSSPHHDLSRAVTRSVLDFWMNTIDRGHCLVFLPGRREIEQTCVALEQAGLIATPLYGALSIREQQRALDPSGPPRVIVATNIAETSLTIDGVTHVIDSGLSRRTYLDTKTRLPGLKTAPIAHDAADQRAGRAGRTQAGQCLRLWTTLSHHQREEATPPEIMTVGLTDALMRVAAWSGDWRSFTWFEKPPRSAVIHAEKELIELGALSETRGTLTPLGETLARFSTHPSLAFALLVSCSLDCREEVAFFCALSEAQRSLLQLSDRHVRAHDPWLRWEAYLDAQEKRYWPELNRSLHAELGQVTQQFIRQLEQVDHEVGQRLEMGAFTQLKSIKDRVAFCFAQSLRYRVGMRRAHSQGGNSWLYRLAGGGEARLEATGIEADSSFIVALTARVTPRGEATIGLAFPILAEWLQLQSKKLALWDDDRGSVIITVQEKIGDLIVRERSELPSPQDKVARDVLRTQLCQDPWRWLTLEGPAQRWLERLLWLGSQKELCSLLSQREMMRPFPHWTYQGDEPNVLIEQLIDGVIGEAISVKQIRVKHFLPLLLGLTPPEWVRWVDQYAPDRYTIPTGQSVMIHYEIGSPPSIKAYLQAFFGESTHPMIGGEGAQSVSLQLHLLAPNQRVTQITSDLPSFWKQGYHDVRRQLRGRYPKHHWPEDPLSIGPQRGAKRRR